MADTKNYHTIGYGTKDGEIKFGHIHEDGVLSGFIARNGHDPNHYITLEASGEPHRKHGTICRSPGSFQVQAGDNVPPNQAGIFFDSVSGDIILRASKGRIRIEAQDIDIIATGGTGTKGNITVEANDTVLINGKQSVDIRSKISTKLASEKTVEVIGNGILNIYGGLIESMDGSTDALSAKGSKLCPLPTPATPREIQQRIISFLKTVT